MLDPIYHISSLFNTGDLVAHKGTGVSGVIVKTYYDELNGQFRHIVRVPGVPAPFPCWGEDVLTASASVHAVAVGDLVIARDRFNEQTMGQILGLRDGKLICRFADGAFLVGMSRVVRVAPASLVRAAAAQLRAA